MFFSKPPNLQDDILKKMLTSDEGVGESPPHLEFRRSAEGDTKRDTLPPANKKAESSACR